MPCIHSYVGHPNSDVIKEFTMNMENSEPLLRTVKLTKTFGSVVANNEVSLEINPGEIHYFLGENGAGISTLSECLYGFYSAH